VEFRITYAQIRKTKNNGISTAVKAGARYSLEYVLWEHNPCINQDISIIVPHKHTIHANFAKTANREYSEGRTIHPFIELLHFSLDRVFQALSGTLGSSQPFPWCSRFLRPCTYTRRECPQLVNIYRQNYSSLAYYREWIVNS